MNEKCEERKDLQMELGINKNTNTSTWELKAGDITGKSTSKDIAAFFNQSLKAGNYFSKEVVEAMKPEDVKQLIDLLTSEGGNDEFFTSKGLADFKAGLVNSTPVPTKAKAQDKASIITTALLANSEKTTEEKDMPAESGVTDGSSTQKLNTFLRTQLSITAIQDTTSTPQSSQDSGIKEILGAIGYGDNIKESAKNGLYLEAKANLGIKGEVTEPKVAIAILEEILKTMTVSAMGREDREHYNQDGIRLAIRELGMENSGSGEAVGKPEPAVSIATEPDGSPVAPTSAQLPEGKNGSASNTTPKVEKPAQVVTQTLGTTTKAVQKEDKPIRQYIKAGKGKAGIDATPKLAVPVFVAPKPQARELGEHKVKPDLVKPTGDTQKSPRPQLREGETYLNDTSIIACKTEHKAALLKQPYYPELLNQLDLLRRTYKDIAYFFIDTDPYHSYPEPNSSFKVGVYYVKHDMREAVNRSIPVMEKLNTVHNDYKCERPELVTDDDNFDCIKYILNKKVETAKPAPANIPSKEIAERMGFTMISNTGINFPKEYQFEGKPACFEFYDGEIIVKIEAVTNSLNEFIIHTSGSREYIYKVKMGEKDLLINDQAWASKTQEKTSGNSSSGSIPARDRASKINTNLDELVIN